MKGRTCKNCHWCVEDGSHWGVCKGKKSVWQGKVVSTLHTCRRWQPDSSVGVSRDHNSSRIKGSYPRHADRCSNDPTM